MANHEILPSTFSSTRRLGDALLPEGETLQAQRSHPSRRRPIAWAVVLLLTRAGYAQDASELEPPSDLVVSQVRYGDEGVVRLTWSNPQSFEAIEVFVDGEPAGDAVDGAATRTELPLAPDTYTLSVRSRVGERISDTVAVADFDVLAASPLGEAITNLECLFLADGGGRLVLRWELGQDSWDAGEIRIAASRQSQVFPEDTTEVELTDVGTAPPVVELAFLRMAGDAGAYFSEAITPDCVTKGPEFRRGDCDPNGVIEVTDAIVPLSHLFQGGKRWACDDACDADDNGEIEITDAVGILMYLFQGGGAPATPGPETCGEDPSVDFLGGVCDCI